MCYLQDYLFDCVHFYGTNIMCVSHLDFEFDPAIVQSLYISFKLFLKSVWFHTSNRNLGK